MGLDLSVGFVKVALHLLVLNAKEMQKFQEKKTLPWFQELFQIDLQH